MIQVQHDVNTRFRNTAVIQVQHDVNTRFRNTAVIQVQHDVNTRFRNHNSCDTSTTRREHTVP